MNRLSGSPVVACLVRASLVLTAVAPLNAQFSISTPVSNLSAGATLGASSDSRLNSLGENVVDVSLDVPMLGTVVGQASTRISQSLNSGTVDITSFAQVEALGAAAVDVGSSNTRVTIVTAGGIEARLRIEWERNGSAPNVLQFVEVDVGLDGIRDFAATTANDSFEMPIPVSDSPRTLEIAATAGLSVQGAGDYSILGRLRISVIPAVTEVDVISTGLCAFQGNPIDIEPNFYGGIDIFPVGSTSGEKFLIVGTDLLPTPVVITPMTCPIEPNPLFVVAIGTQALRVPGDPSLGTLYLQGLDLSTSLDLFPGRTFEVRF